MTSKIKKDTTLMTEKQIWDLYDRCMWHSDLLSHSYFDRDKWRQLALEYKYDLIVKMTSGLDELSLSRLIPIAQERHDCIAR